MTSRVPPIARIRLARSVPRLLAWPSLLAAAGVAILVGGLVAGGAASLLTAGFGGLLVLTGIFAAARLLSVRLDIEEAVVRLRAVGSERQFDLVPGPVTRVRLTGDNASSLKSRTRMLGYDLGAAVLRDEEQIEIVRLARTDSAILIPTERGRLAIAPADEAALLDALSRAAQARQRLDALAMPDLPEGAGEPEPMTAPEPPADDAEPEPAAMTGIERAIYERTIAEERMAAERAAELLLAEEARRLEEAAAAQAAAEQAETAVPADAMTAPTRPRLARRAIGAVPRPAWIRRPEPSLALVVLPLVGAGAVWGFGIARDSLPAAGTDLGRLTALALVLAGPGTTVGAIMARIWWPRLVGVVVVGGLATAVFAGRAILG